MWNGVTPNMARNAVINAAELATYDQIKQVLIKSGKERGGGGPGCSIAKA